MHTCTASTQTSEQENLGFEVNLSYLVKSRFKTKQTLGPSISPSSLELKQQQLHHCRKNEMSGRYTAKFPVLSVY